MSRHVAFTNEGRSIDGKPKGDPENESELGVVVRDFSRAGTRDGRPGRSYFPVDLPENVPGPRVRRECGAKPFRRQTRAPRTPRARPVVRRSRRRRVFHRRSPPPAIAAAPTTRIGVPCRTRDRGNSAAGALGGKRPRPHWIHERTSRSVDAFGVKRCALLRTIHTVARPNKSFDPAVATGTVNYERRVDLGFWSETGTISGPRQLGQCTVYAYRFVLDHHCLA